MPQTILNQEQFCAQVISCQDTLFHIAKAILCSDEDAEDAVQEAICSAFANRAGLRETEKFKPWITRILTNKCYDICRKRRVIVDLSDVENVLPAPDTNTPEKLALWQAVMMLSDDLRVTITLFYYEGFSIREISSIQGITQAAVKSRLSRGRTRLRQLLEER